MNKTGAEKVKWDRRYQLALRRYLKAGPTASLRTALKLGHQAVALGLETLDVARLHAQVLAALPSTDRSSKITRQEEIEHAEPFFIEVIVPVEATHCAARRAEASIDRLTQDLRQRTKESSASAAELEQAVAARQAAEATLKEGADKHARLLAEAQDTQERLQRRMHDILSAQESQRQEISDGLRDEIAQALIAIDLSLLALKTSADTDTKSLEQDIGNAQRLLVQYAEEARNKDP